MCIPIILNFGRVTHHGNTMNCSIQVRFCNAEGGAVVNFLHSTLMVILICTLLCTYHPLQSHPRYRWVDECGIDKVHAKWVLQNFTNRTGRAMLMTVATWAMMHDATADWAVHSGAGCSLSESNHLRASEPMSQNAWNCCRLPTSSGTFHSIAAKVEAKQLRFKS